MLCIGLAVYYAMDQTPCQLGMFLPTLVIPGREPTTIYLEVLGCLVKGGDS